MDKKVFKSFEKSLMPNRISYCVPHLSHSTKIEIQIWLISSGYCVKSTLDYRNAIIKRRTIPDQLCTFIKRYRTLSD